MQKIMLLPKMNKPHLLQNDIMTFPTTQYIFLQNRKNLRLKIVRFLKWYLCFMLSGVVENTICAHLSFSYALLIGDTYIVTLICIFVVITENYSYCIF